MIQKNVDELLTNHFGLHIATVARSTVISSGFPPTASMPFSRAFCANGDMKFPSNARLLAIKAMELATP